MGNPAEKTIRNPNLGPLLVKVRRAVNKNCGLQQKFLPRMGESIGIWPVQILYTNCISTKHEREP